MSQFARVLRFYRGRGSWVGKPTERPSRLDRLPEKGICHATERSEASRYFIQNKHAEILRFAQDDRRDRYSAPNGAMARPHPTAGLRGSFELKLVAAWADIHFRAGPARRGRYAYCQSE